MRASLSALAISALTLVGERDAGAGREERQSSHAELARQNGFGQKRWSAVAVVVPTLREDGLVEFSVLLGLRRTIRVVAEPNEWVDVGIEGGGQLPTVAVRARVSAVGRLFVERRWTWADRGLFGAGFPHLTLAMDGTLRGRYRSIDFEYEVPHRARTFDFDHAGERIRLYLRKGRIVAIGKISEPG